MEPAILQRLVLALLLAGALWGAYRLVTSVVLSKARRGARRLAGFVPGLPGVVFFTTPECVTCKAAQRPALSRLEERLRGRVQVIEIDAKDNAELAREWSVLSVPTTFVLDPSGEPRLVNHGYASTEKLIGQLREAGRSEAARLR
jgi:thiol-disulfide isomerase/thioredoxin